MGDKGGEARLACPTGRRGAAALSPFVIEVYGVSLVEIGMLIGLYLAPGIVVALPGGAIAARFGEKRIVALSMGLMLIGATEQFNLMLRR